MQREMTKPPRFNIYVLLVGTFFILLALFVVITVSQDIRREKERFAENAYFIATYLESVVNQNRIALRGFAAFLQSSDLNDDIALGAYARAVVHDHGPLYALGLIRKVNKADLENFVLQRRAEGAKEFQAKAYAGERTAPFRGLEDKPSYRLVSFLESAEPQELTLLGLDADSAPYFRDTLRRSLVAGDAMATAPFRVGGGDLGYALLRPVSSAQGEFVALLLCKASSLLPPQVIGDTRLSVAVYQQGASAEDRDYLIRREAFAPGPLAALIFPKFSVVRSLAGDQQPYAIEVERSLDWEDINWDMLAAILSGGTLVFPLLLLYASSHHKREMKRLEQGNKLFYMANFDALTGLPNRQLFMNRLEQSLAVAKRQGLMHAVLFLDLDGFKGVNDYYGHQIGDKVLQRAARIFLRSVREIDTVARLGGDEFVILLQGVDGRASAEHVARKIKRAFRNPAGDASRSAIPMIGTSIGIAIYPDDGDTVDELLNAADLNMYQDKVSRKSSSQAPGSRKADGRKDDAD